MGSKRAVLNFFLALGAAAPWAAHACSCAPIAIEDAYAKAPTVFLATILETRADTTDALKTGYVRFAARYRVDESFKGNPALVETLQVRSRVPNPEAPQLQLSGSCDMPPFAPGEQWLVFAGQEKIVDAKACGATRRIRQGDPQLEQLRKLR